MEKYTHKHLGGGVMNQAEKACLTLWKYLATTGCEFKWHAVRRLHKIGKLDKNEYLADCPLCQEYNDYKGCIDCPWPGDGQARCLENELYEYWVSSPSKKTASAVYQYIKKFLTDKEPPCV